MRDLGTIYASRSRTRAAPAGECAPASALLVAGRRAAHGNVRPVWYDCALRWCRASLSLRVWRGVASRLWTRRSPDAGSLRLVRYRSVDGGFRWRGFPFRSRHITLNIYLFRVSCVRVCPLPTRSTPCQLVSHDTHSQCACRSPPRPRRRAGPSASRVDVLYGTLALSVPNRCVTVSCQARSVCVHLLCGGISGVQSNTIIFVSFFAASIEFARRARSTAAALGS